MPEGRFASVILNNYNYARFLRESIDSALAQTYPDVEVIVVDDGSTDESRRILESYGNRVVPILQSNGGQTSAVNAGFRASRGDVVFFVDADDVLLPKAVECAMKAFDDPDVAKVHWALLEIGADSRETGRVLCEDLPEGDVRETLVREGPENVYHPPTTGNAFARRFLEQVFPMPLVHAGLRGADCVDSHLCGLAPLFGPIARLSQPLARYRIHGNNGYASLNFEDRLRRDVLSSNHVCDVVAGKCRELGIEVDREVWKGKSWAQRISRAIEDIAAIVPTDDAVVLVDEDGWNTDRQLAGRKRFLFLERDGQYWGNPEDDAAAIRELESLRSAGARFIVFAWSAFWYFDYYSGFHEYLRTRFARVHADERIVVFDLNATRLPVGS